LSSATQPLYAKLKPGPGRSSEEVFANQRARLRGAMSELTAERGYETVTVRDLSFLAGISTRSFYKNFPNVEECFAYTYESLMRSALRRAYRAQQGTEDWEGAIRASLAAVIEGITRRPKAAQLVLVEAFAPGPAMQPRMRTSIAGFERLLLDSLPAAVAKSSASRHVVRGAAAGVMRVARTRLLGKGVADSAEVAEQLADWMLVLLREQGLDFELGDRRLPEWDDGAAGQHRKDPAAVFGAPGDEEGRILAAVAKLGISAGFAKLTVPTIRAEAGVSRRSFDARFTDVAECFLEAIERTAVAAGALVGRPAPEGSSWESGVQQGILALCAEVARSPVLSRLAFIDVLAPGRQGLQRRERLVTLGAEQLGKASPLGRRPSGLAAEASIGAAWRIAHADVAAGRARRLPHLAPVLTHVTLTPTIALHKQTVVSQIKDIDSN
jgi:AcrR family transcriptional regulator